ncbi:MAG: hypothetical protein J5449_00480 [Oscillospiraceae bacterium]|nr:hypothetical protein [Oscillospiraceae bacterium]
MTDQELRAHELAVVFTQELHHNLRAESDKSTLDFLYKKFLEDYQSAYEYFSRHIS